MTQGLFVLSLIASSLAHGFADIISFAGDVKVETTTGTQTDIDIGSRIKVGEKVLTADNSWAKLLLDDDSIVDLGARTSWTMDEVVQRRSNSMVRSSLNRGRLRAKVKKRIRKGNGFEIKTRSAVMGVRGTEFGVIETEQTVEKGTSINLEVTVGEGTVRLDAEKGDQIVLDAGQSLVLQSLIVDDQVQEILRSDQLQLESEALDQKLDDLKNPVNSFTGLVDPQSGGAAGLEKFLTASESDSRDLLGVVTEELNFGQIEEDIFEERHNSADSSLSGLSSPTSNSNTDNSNTSVTVEIPVE